MIRTRFRIPGVATRIWRSAASLWFPEYDALVDRRNNVLAVLRRPGELARLIPGQNIITDAGDIFFAQRGAAESPTNGFTTWEMASAGTPGKGSNRSNFTLIGSSQQAQDGTYPKSNDGDTDNTGRAADARTTRVSYTAASFSHSAITHGIITNATPGASEPILAGWAWAASINKTSADTLKAFHNATNNGV